MSTILDKAMSTTILTSDGRSIAVTIDDGIVVVTVARIGIYPNGSIHEVTMRLSNTEADFLAQLLTGSFDKRSLTDERKTFE
jgi:hypothetical protein